MSNISELVARLRAACSSIRVKPWPIAEVVPMLQEAADMLEQMEKAEPLFYVRLLQDGLYEGPIHRNNLDYYYGDWTPLFTHPPARELSADLLETIDNKAQAGLCQMTHAGTREFLKDIRAILAAQKGGV